MAGPNVLIVGAGAIGQVYGAHLAAGGARVSVLVKPKHSARALTGYTLYRLRLWGRPKRQRLDTLGVYTEVTAVGSERWDQVWLTIPSDALAGEWLRELGLATGSATVVSQHGGPEDADRIRAAFGEARVVHGPIPLLAYGVPLDASDTLGEGTRYLLPPVPQGFSGAEGARVLVVVEALRRGGMLAHRTRDALSTYEHNTALFIPIVAALELNDWSFAALSTSVWLDEAVKAGTQSVRQLRSGSGARPPLWLSLWRASWLRALLPVAPRLTPLPLEAFFRYHFSKVGVQTELMLRGHVQAGQARGLPMGATAALLEALRERRSERRAELAAASSLPA